MLKSNCTKPWNKKTGAITALVALVGMTSVLYSVSALMNNQFVSAVIDNRNELENRIHPWNISEQTLATNQDDVLSTLIDAKKRISEIDDMILQNLRMGIYDASLFEEKGDLLAEIGQFNKALTYYEEAFDLNPHSNIQDKILRTQTSLGQIERISNYYN